MTNRRIRSALPTDYESINVLYAALDEHHRRLEPTRYQCYEGPARPREGYLRCLKSDSWEVWVAERDSVVVGFAKAERLEAPPYPMFRTRRTVCVHDLCVHPGARKKGIGEALMRAVSEWSKGQGATHLELSVMQSNSIAAGFYERLGFQPIRIHLEREIDASPPTV